MKIIDCYWEKNNLNKKTVEVEFASTDIVSEETINELSLGYEYIVIKVPANRVDINFILSKAGFTMIETQMTISKNYKDFNFEDKYISYIYDDVDFLEIESETDFNRLICEITPNMFSTDRIYLDPQFGPIVSSQRYKNWLTSSFLKRENKFYEYLYKGNRVGFTMYKEENNTWKGLLGGVYENYQKEGLGMLTASSFFLYAKKKEIKMKKLVGAISSNNVPMVSIYNYLDFKLLSNNYVYIKHQNF